MIAEKKQPYMEAAGTVYDNLPEPEPKDDSEKFEPSFLDRGYNWIFIPKIGFNC